MTELRVVGAGLGRTGTFSLKTALEQLLGGPCYHMVEVFQHREHIAVWHAATRGEPVDFRALLGGYVAAVDWPVSAFWRELSELFPRAKVVLSIRDADSWWRSASRTIFARRIAGDVDPEDPHMEMVTDLLERRFTPGFCDESTAKAAYEAHVADVRRSVPDDRRVEWSPSQGWGPLCAALGVPVPREPFPHLNTTDEFRARAGLDA